jgi:hypothetical protein
MSMDILPLSSGSKGAPFLEHPIISAEIYFYSTNNPLRYIKVPIIMGYQDTETAWPFLFYSLKG